MSFERSNYAPFISASAETQRQLDAFRRFEQIKADEEYARCIARGEEPVAKAEVKSEEKRAAPVSMHKYPIVKQTFTPENVEEIKKHFESLPARADGDHLQELMSAVLEDDAIKFEFVCNPVFIKGDGQILDREVALDLLKNNRPSPRAAIVFEEKDIIPCQPIIAAMRELLNIINKTSATTDNLVIDENAKTNYKKLTSFEINAINLYYNSLTPQQKRLFNIVCRGADGHLLEDPVLMKDGQMYEREKAEKLSSPDDLTPCHFTLAVLEKITAKIHQKLQKSFEEKSEKPQPEIKAVSSQPAQPVDFTKITGIKLLEVREAKLSNSEYAEERDQLVEEVKQLMIRLKSSDSQVSRPELANHDMQKVLEACIYSLETLSSSYIYDACQNFPNFGNVKTKFGGTVALHSRYGKFANSMGSVTNQPGWLVESLLNKVEQALMKFQPTNNLYAR